VTRCGAKANGTPCWTINSSLRRSFCTRCGMRDAREVAMGVGRSLRISCFGMRLPSNKRRIIPARNSNLVLSLVATRSRITDVMSSKVSEDAAELEYKIFVNRLWISALSLITFIFIGLAIHLASWSFGGSAIAAYVAMFLLLVRMFALRRQYYRAASSSLGFRVSFRHPPWSSKLATSIKRESTPKT